MKIWASKYLIWKAMKIPPFNRDAYLRPRIVLLGCLEPEADWILVKELVHTLPSLVQDKCPNFRWTHRVSTPFKHSGNCENSLTALSSSQQAAVQPVPAPSVSSLNCLGLCPVFVCFLNDVITSISPTNDNNFIFGSPTYSCWRCSMNVILYLDMYVDKYSVEVFVYNLPNNLWYSACLNIKGIIFNISHI